MSNDNGIAASYDVRPSQLGEALEAMIAAGRSPMVWGPPGTGKSAIASQVADKLGMEYYDVRAMLLDPVDLRGIPWRDEDNMTRWAPPVFLPPMKSKGKFLVNLDEVANCTPMVQSALHQLVYDRRCGEYELPEGALVMACGNRVADRSGVHRMSMAFANRFVHFNVCVDVDDWTAWGAENGIAPEVLFYMALRPKAIHRFDPKSKEMAYPSYRSWEFVSDFVKAAAGTASAHVERATYVGTVGEAEGVEFYSFLKIWRQLPHPRTVIQDPHNAPVPSDPSTLIALCGSLYSLLSEERDAGAADVHMESVVTYAERLRPEVGEYLIGSCIRHNAQLRNTQAFIKWASAKSRN